MKVLHHDDPRMYEVLRDEAGQHYLEVVCGTIAFYTVLIRLSDDEVAQFKADRKALDNLADLIAFRPEQYRARTVRTGT